MSASEDQADVEKVLAGETDAFERIVRRWQRPLINLAYRFFRDHGRAEEMAQAAFLRAYRALSQWRKEAAFSSWLFALTTNLYRSELRRIPARTISIEDAGELEDARAADGELEEEEPPPRGARTGVHVAAKISRRDRPFLFSRYGHIGCSQEPWCAGGHGESQVVSGKRDSA